MPRPTPATVARFLEVMHRRHGLASETPALRPAPPPMTDADGARTDPLPTTDPEDDR